jgi:hypothetical protein
MSDIKEGTKMLYCKVSGDKSTEEVVDVISVHSDFAGGGVTIYIPSLKRERDTEVSRLSHIVEKKEKIDNYFGKPRLELPEISQEIVIRAPSQRCSPRGKNPICIQIPPTDNFTFSADYTFYSITNSSSSLFSSGDINIRIGEPPNDYLTSLVPFNISSKIVVGVKMNILMKFSTKIDLNSGYTNNSIVIVINGEECVTYEHNNYLSFNQYIRIGSPHQGSSNGLDALVENLKITIPNSYKQYDLTMQSRDEVLLDNQRLLFNQLNSLQETIKLLQRKPNPVDEQLKREVVELRKINSELLANQLEMSEEILKIRNELVMK